MKELFEAIRDQCSKQIWSKGVTLARSDSVTGDQKSDEEIVLRVMDQDRGVGPQVTLWPDDEDWQCDCHEKADPCQHVAAAIIALKRAAEKGLELPKSKKAGGHIEYHLSIEDGELKFQRMAVWEDGKRPIVTPLSPDQRGYKHIPVTPTKEDWEVESALRNQRIGHLDLPTWKRTLPHLAKTGRTFFEGEPIDIIDQVSKLQAILEDEPPHIRLRIQPNPSIKNHYAPGLCHTDQGIGLAMTPELSVPDQRFFKEGQLFGPKDLGKLVGELLPKFKDRLDIINRCKNLPTATHAKVSIELQLKTLKDGLEVTPRLTYGSPPLARVINGVLHALTDEVPTRDRHQERMLSDRLSRDFDLRVDETQIKSRDEAIRLSRVLGSLHSYLFTEDPIDFRVRGSLAPSLSIDDQGGLHLSFEMETDANGEALKPESTHSVLKAFEVGDDLVPLTGGGFGKIPQDWLRRYGSKIAELLQSRDDQDQIPRANWPEAAQLMESMGERVPGAIAELKSQLEDADLPDFQLPEEFTAKLRPYQWQGVQWLGRMQSLGLSALLADDMGLGKTVQTIAILKGRCLIVAPTSVLPNWQKEIHTFYPACKTTLYHGPNRSFDSLKNPQTPEVILTSYTILRMDQEKLGQENWDVVVLDEAHQIKNPKSQVSQAAYSLSAKFKLALTGTPIENRLSDLHSQFQFLHPGFLGNAPFFQERYARQIAKGHGEPMERLKKRIAPFFMRRLKTEVLTDLPKRTEVALFADLDTEERTLYDSLLLASKKEVINKLQQGGGVMDALEALLRLRQAACHPALIPGQEAPGSSKVELLMERLGQVTEAGHKALVFSQWTKFLDLLEDPLSLRGIPFSRLDGSTKDRGKVVDEFNQVDGPPVLIMSLKAGGVGLNLTAADHVFILDPWWNPAIEQQAADRAHRIGQTNPVLVSRLIARNTVEESIMALKARKEQLAKATLSGEAQPIQQLDAQELLSLFESL